MLCLVLVSTLEKCKQTLLWLVPQQTRKNACQLLVLSLLTRSDSRIIVEGEAGEGWDRVAGDLE